MGEGDLHIRLTTKLAVSAETAATLVGTPALLEYVAAPLLRFAPVDPPAFPHSWEERRYRVRVMFAGVVPMGRQWIDISRENDPSGSFRMRDNGSGDLARKWDHRITIEPDGEGRCIYADKVEIEAGPLTFVVWGFARLFYAHRQLRWRRLTAGGGVAARALMARVRWQTRFDAELLAFAAARETNDVAGQWRALERAHILSQVSLSPHLKVHRLMLDLARRLGDHREVLGQAVRLLLAPLGSLSGRIPWGNTGRSTVSAFETMPVPQDLRDVLPRPTGDQSDRA